MAGAASAYCSRQTARATQGSADEALIVDMMLLEQVGEDWIDRSEPSVRVRLNEEANVTVSPSKLAPHSLSISIKAVRDNTWSADRRDACPSASALFRGLADNLSGSTATAECGQLSASFASFLGFRPPMLQLFNP
jgi:hypothetical protein